MHVCLFQGLVISLAGGLGGAGLCLIHYLRPPEAPSIILSILKLPITKEREVVEKQREGNSHSVVSVIAIF